jgi:hypothetical protein
MRVFACGAAAGFAASVLMSAIARVMPGMDMDPKLGSDKLKGTDPPPPEDPFNPAQVREWQQHSQTPAVFGPKAARLMERRGREGAGASTAPAAALVQPQAPGPEGLAEQFAYKVASGVFNKDIAPQQRAAGIATHLAYGSAWGALFGLIQGTWRRAPAPFGALYGLIVYAVGPALVVPAMKLMRPPTEEPPLRTGVMIAGHVVYGVALAQTFASMTGRKR